MRLIRDVLLTFLVAFLTAAAVTWLWSLVFEGDGVVDWKTSFVLGAAIGTAVPVALAAAGGARSARNGAEP